jgi:hypothetical protein
MADNKTTAPPVLRNTFLHVDNIPQTNKDGAVVAEKLQVDWLCASSTGSSHPCM